MHLVTYHHRGETRTGALLDQWIVDLNRAYSDWAGATGGRGNPAELAVADARVPTEMIALLAGGEAALEAAARGVDHVRERLPAGDRDLRAGGLLCSVRKATLLPPVLRPKMVICLGLNYRAHAAEANWEPPAYPMLFHKTSGCLIGHGQTIVIPRGCNRADYEGELAVIIGRRCKHVSEAEALRYVAGYTVANDISERELQFRTRQFTAGKMPDTFGPLGPALVTRDEIPDPGALQIKTTLNGQVMQHSNTGQMIFSVAAIINYISAFATLDPGDVILTGTPEGVGNARDPKVFLQPGDSVTVEIERVGTLTNPVAADL